MVGWINKFITKYMEDNSTTIYAGMCCVYTGSYIVHWFDPELADVFGHRTTPLE